MPIPASKVPATPPYGGDLRSNPLRAPHPRTRPYPLRVFDRALPHFANREDYLRKLAHELATEFDEADRIALAELLDPGRGRPAQRCPVCEEVFYPHAAGPPPTFCSSRCRTRASRAGGLSALLAAREDEREDAAEAALAAETEW